jgi:hypothetical protein
MSFHQEIWDAQKISRAKLNEKKIIVILRSQEIWIWFRGIWFTLAGIRDVLQ